MKIRTYTTSITGFTYNDNALTVYFDKRENAATGSAIYKRAFAHPALQVKPHIGKVQEIQIAETEQGWKMIKPYPTEQEIADWTKAKAEKEALQAKVAEATEAQLALLTF
jgi:hypothetical protein